MSVNVSRVSFPVGVRILSLELLLVPVCCSNDNGSAVSVHYWVEIEFFERVNGSNEIARDYQAE